MNTKNFIVITLIYVVLGTIQTHAMGPLIDRLQNLHKEALKKDLLIDSWIMYNKCNSKTLSVTTKKRDLYVDFVRATLKKNQDTLDDKNTTEIQTFLTDIDKNESNKYEALCKKTYNFFGTTRNIAALVAAYSTVLYALNYRDAKFSQGCLYFTGLCLVTSCVSSQIQHILQPRVNRITQNAHLEHLLLKDQFETWQKENPNLIEPNSSDSSHK